VTASSAPPPRTWSRAGSTSRWRRKVAALPHPHIGLATVTYLFDGEILHRDSLGSEQVIRPGDVNWMTAGRGIAHSERTPAEVRARGGRVHGLQSWVALPLAHEEAEPAFHHHASNSIPATEQAGARLRVIAGTAYGLESPVRPSGRRPRRA
jgi:hypothetical protein